MFFISVFENEKKNLFDNQTHFRLKTQMTISRIFSINIKYTPSPQYARQYAGFYFFIL